MKAEELYDHQRGINFRVPLKVTNFLKHLSVYQLLKMVLLRSVA